MLDLFKSCGKMAPEILTEYFFIIESIGNDILNLFFNRSVEIFKRVNNNALFLAFKCFL